MVRSDLVAQLAQAGNITQAADKPLILDASSSYDPDNTSSSLQFTWSCANPDTGSPQCLDSTEGVLTWTSSNGNMQIAAGTLKSSTVYLFKCTVGTLDGRTVTLPAFVNILYCLIFICFCLALFVHNYLDLMLHVLPGGAISVAIEVKFSYITSTFYLRARTDSTLGLSLSYRWSSPSFNLSASPALLSTSTTLSTLTMSYANLPGGSYPFAVMVSSGSSPTSVSSVSVDIPGVPISGSCHVFPASGYALTTPFTLSCLNWQSGIAGESSSSLQYAYSYILDGREVSLGPARYSPSLQVTLPSPSGSSTLQLIARVINPAPFYSTAMVNLSATVQVPVCLRSFFFFF